MMERHVRKGSTDLETDQIGGNDPEFGNSVYDKIQRQKDVAATVAQD